MLAFQRPTMTIPLLSLLFFGIAAIAPAQDAAPEWPWFRGPGRNGISSETGLLKKWPTEGPKLLWTIQGLGRGYSTVSIKDGVLYTAGTVSHQSYVVAADLSGKIKWKALNGSEWKAPEDTKSWAKDFDGTRATPTIDGTTIFHMNETGRLAAFDAADGKEKWFIDLPKQFQAAVPRWGYSESVLIDGERLICYPGGKKGGIVALNKNSGQLIWANIDLADEPAYSSPTLVEDHGYRQIITMTRTAVIGVAAETGKLLWRFEHINRYKENCEMPLYQDSKVLVSSAYGRGSDLLNLTYGPNAITVDRVWTNPKADNQSGGPLLLNGHIYAAGYDNKGWFCLDFETGKQTCADPKIGRAALSYADGLIYAFLDNGVMTLSEPSPDGFKPISQFKVPSGGPGPCLAHPVICGGRLYIRHSDKLYAYDIAGP